MTYKIGKEEKKQILYGLLEEFIRLIYRHIRRKYFQFNMNYLKDIRLILSQQKVETTPCSNDEIQDINRIVEYKLPKAYLEFLEEMGKDAGKFMKGSSCFINELHSLREWAIELLVENNFKKELPNDAFVFWMHQGYQFAFFLLDDGDNPPIYYYNETKEQNKFCKTGDSFTDFLRIELAASNIVK